MSINSPSQGGESFGNSDENNVESRQDLWFSTTAGLAALALVVGKAEAAGTATTTAAVEAEEAVEKKRVITNPRIEIMEGHNMPPGFIRSRIYADIDGHRTTIGSIFFLDGPEAKADLITRQTHPQFFDQRGVPDFEAVQRSRTTEGGSTALLVAGAYLNPDGGGIKGVALENGVMVGQQTPTHDYNGILVIKDGIPSIEYLNQIPDIDQFLEEAKREGWHLFQQTSYIRPGGKFTTRKPDKYDLRFFVEGEGRRAVINLSVPMTYAEGVPVIENLDGLNIEKAIGLDTGSLSEGYLYDKEGEDYLMNDQRFGAGSNYTNLLELYSGE